MAGQLGGMALVGTPIARVGWKCSQGTFCGPTKALTAIIQENDFERIAEAGDDACCLPYQAVLKIISPLHCRLVKRDTFRTALFAISELWQEEQGLLAKLADWFRSLAVAKPVLPVLSLLSSSSENDRVSILATPYLKGAKPLDSLPTSQRLSRSLDLLERLAATSAW